MALDFGYRVNDERDGIWIGDPALMAVPESAVTDWEKDGIAAHLLPYAKNGQPSILKFRALNFREDRYVRRHFGMGVGGALIAAECFALAVRFPDMQEVATARNGTKVSTMERRGDFTVLSDAFLQHLDEKLPGLINFFGNLIFEATYPSLAEKKASSPPSTETPSLAAVSTKADTAVPSGAPADPVA